VIVSKTMGEKLEAMAIDVRATAARSVRGAGRFLARVFSYACTIALILLAVGSAVGRVRLAPAPPHRTATSYTSSDLLVVVPCRRSG
jgi:hypothetical protein